MRNFLFAGLCLAALGLGLATTWVHSRNHARADLLARVQREWEMHRAANAAREARLLSHVAGRTPKEQP